MATRPGATPTSPGSNTFCTTWRPAAKPDSSWPTAPCRPTSLAKARSARTSSMPAWWTASSPCRASCSAQPRSPPAFGSCRVTADVAERRDETLFIDARNLGHMIDRTRREPLRRRHRPHRQPPITTGATATMRLFLPLLGETSAKLGPPSSVRPVLIPLLGERVGACPGRVTGVRGLPRRDPGVNRMLRVETPPRQPHQPKVPLQTMSMPTSPASARARASTRSASTATSSPPAATSAPRHRKTTANPSRRRWSA